MNRLQQERIQRWAKEEAEASVRRARITQPELGELSVGAYITLLDEIERSIVMVVHKGVDSEP